MNGRRSLLPLQTSFCMKFRKVLMMKGNEMKERRKTEGFLVSHDKKTIIRLTSRHETQVTDTHRLFFYPGCLLSFVSIQMNDQIALWVEIQGRERERDFNERREEEKRVREEERWRQWLVVGCSLIRG